MAIFGFGRGKGGDFTALKTNQGKTMHKFSFRALVCAAGVFGFAAMAQATTWVTTEEDEAGLKYAQGSWTTNADTGDNITGTAELVYNNAKPLTYSFSGGFKDGVYTLTLTDRSDNRKNCVWTGKPPRAGSSQTTGFAGWVQCDGIKFVIRANHY